ncbi:uncharacterized protein TNIN_462701 [Trichonephila inaurata madagascariensis]|uniref:Uncharacterized protein n=1 Tax=Trichonephila inaurata madagascariensis TaxID=2747483 RepID=A0A8X6XAR4_9ARAC|nr:uncharacterized protein TNIN_462701 [Trichonephila inaurata madagascariensis]
MLIRNVPNDVDDSELLDVIREQNLEILVSNECWKESRVRFVLKKFQHVRTVVIEFHPKIRKNVNAAGSLKIMWNMCRIEDFLVINRCFQCLGYNHRANECTNTLSCYFALENIRVTTAQTVKIRLEISGIEVSSSNFTSSFEGTSTIDAVLRKSFPCDPNSHNNSQHRVLRSEAELIEKLSHIYQLKQNESSDLSWWLWNKVATSYTQPS